jgi:hypothetical protein
MIARIAKTEDLPIENLGNNGNFGNLKMDIEP